MGINYFTDEQIEILKDNPYVEHVSEKAITYTEKFREEFYQRYSQSELPSVILRDMGFDPKILGKKRVSNLTSRIKKQAMRSEGFKDTRLNNSGRPKTKDMSKDEEIEYLKHKIEFLKQQNEALKKINFVNRKIQWEEKQRQKNSKSFKK